MYTVRMTNYFQGTAESPFHISIGAIVLNEAGKVCCHYFKKFEHKDMGTFEDFYLLMRETIEPGETIEGCLARGLKEELGVVANIRSYAGSIVSRFKSGDAMIEKTTLYFLCDLVSQNESDRSANDPESGSEIRWMDRNELAGKMEEQGMRFGREDMDESKVLRT